MFFFFKQKAAYEMRISDWSSDVCSSDLPGETMKRMLAGLTKPPAGEEVDLMSLSANDGRGFVERMRAVDELPTWLSQEELDHYTAEFTRTGFTGGINRSEEHTSELQSLMRISYAVFCLKKTKQKPHTTRSIT